MFRLINNRLQEQPTIPEPKILNLTERLKLSVIEQLDYEKEWRIFIKHRDSLRSCEITGDWSGMPELLEEGVHFKIGWIVTTTSYQGEGSTIFDTEKDAIKKYDKWSKYNGQLQCFTYPPKLVAIPIREVEQPELDHPEEGSAYLEPSQKPKDIEEAAKELEVASGKYADKVSFRIPYDGSNKFYDDDHFRWAKEAFIAGANWKSNQQKEQPKERFIRPTDEQIVKAAILFNDGKLEPDVLANMVGLCQWVIDRLYENGHITFKSSKE